MKAVVFTLGCKVNEAESGAIMAALEKMGFEVSDALSPADIYVLNTCAVTREAEKKSRQLVARVRKFNQNAEIFVCGCASEKDKKAFEERGVTFVGGARDKGEVVKAVSQRFNLCGCGLQLPKQTGTRAFIKIQDGCNNFCSYCIIPYLRGREKSRSIEDILGEIAQTDCPEIVLNGINISSYGYDGKTLTHLIRALSNEKKRIRLGSLECNIITVDFLESLKNLPDFAEQFHLSLQSGSNAVLKAMNRHYTREEYLEKCGLIYKYFPQAAITTDIIAGFATETEEDFEESLSIIEEARFARVHAFAFSPREGTVAFKLKDLPPEVKSGRLHRLLTAAERAQSQYIAGFIGKELDFIAEERQNGYTCGYTGNYIKVYLADEVRTGEKYKVILKEKFADGAYVYNNSKN
ncbi:MAG: MiaB/RimO family radical SAM methylthiotransferase [Clostridia bacterium]|nr:MiaB/RimO family radical SAM methylthiotransferase [Clostridia bacterium]